MNECPVAVRVALLTPVGRGALAVVGVAGPDAGRLAEARFRPHGGGSLAARGARSISVGRWHARGPIADAGEELVVVRQATDRLEVHCHGGHAAAEAVLAGLEAAGAVRQSWPAWLRHGDLDPVELEARTHLARAAGPRAARILCRQATGLLQEAMHELACLRGPARTARVDRLLRAARIGLRLTGPWRVVLVGPVNAGKSSLANALAGHTRSLVSPEPGTTRDLVTTRLVLGGWEVELCDTAGRRSPDQAASATERAGMERAAAAAGVADLVLRVVPTGAALPPAADRELVVITKVDLAARPPAAPPGSVVTSAVSRQGIDELIATIVARLVPEDRAEPDLLAGPVPFTPRQVEAIRRLGGQPQLNTVTGGGAHAPGAGVGGKRRQDAGSAAGIE